jgi:hypothetical protein
MGRTFLQLGGQVLAHVVGELLAAAQGRRRSVEVSNSAAAWRMLPRSALMTVTPGVVPFL